MEEEEQQEAGELVTDILRRRLADVAISDTPLHHLLAHLHANHVALDVVFHVRLSDDLHSAVVDERNVLRVLAHSSILRKESDYFREILQRHPTLSISDDDAQSGASIKQEDVGHSLQQEYISNTENSSLASNYSHMAEHDLSLPIAARDNPMYILPNCAADMQEEHVHAHDINGADLPNRSIVASTMNEIVGREVLAHVQSQIVTRSDGQAAKQPADQGFHSCKPSLFSGEGMEKKGDQAERRLSDQAFGSCTYLSADGMYTKNEQNVRCLSDQEYHSCKPSFLSADGTYTKNEQNVRRLSDQEYHSCKSSFLSADGMETEQGVRLLSELESPSCKASFLPPDGHRTPENTCADRSSSSCRMSMSAILPSMLQGCSANSTRASLQSPPLDLAPRRSILLGNDERKAAMDRSMRKSVRFSLEPAGIILPVSLTDNIQRVEPNDMQVDTERANQSGTAGISSDKSVDNMEGLSSCVDNSSCEAACVPAPPERINKLLIKRRDTEMNIVMERGSANDTLFENEEDATSTYSFKFYIVKKLTWTAPVLIGIMEWMYLGMCHINLEDLPGLYDAAYTAVITSLTWCIRRHAMPEYLNLALSNPLHCKHLLKLCLVADCIELSSLKGFCEALQAIHGQPKIAILETKHLPGSRANDFLTEGFFVLDGHPLCVLKTSKPNEFESPRGFESDYGQRFLVGSDPPPFVTFARHLQPAGSNYTSSSMRDQHTSLSSCESPQEQVWKVVLLDDDPAGSFYAFFKYVSMCSLRSLTQEGRYSMIKKMLRKRDKEHVGLFKLQMITRFKVGAILVESLSKAIRQGLNVREKRGSGSFIKGPSYCTSIVIKGDPCKVLMAAKAIPYDMVGRSALKIRAVCAKTFSSLFHASHTFGVDLHSHSIVLVKPLYVLIKVLEFLTKLNIDAYEAPSTERTFIELCQPTEPF